MAFLLLAEASHFIQIAVDLKFEDTLTFEEFPSVPRPPRDS